MAIDPFHLHRRQAGEQVRLFETLDNVSAALIHAVCLRLKRQSNQLVGRGVKQAPANPASLTRIEKIVDNSATNGDYRAMGTFNNNSRTIAKLRRMIVLPVWHTMLRPVVRSRIR